MSENTKFILKVAVISMITSVVVTAVKPTIMGFIKKPAVKA